jgi:phage terminase large subunit-like protein
MNNQISNIKLTDEIIEGLVKDQQVRRNVVKESHMTFFHLYFNEYVQYETAEFQREMFKITENDDLKLAIIVAFRGSGKSTIMTMSYPIWSILGKQQKKCVVILSQTQQQAKIHLTNIKRELESNELLRRDLGPFEEQSDE